MESPPANPFSSSGSGGGVDDNNHRFDAFQLSPDKNTTAGAGSGSASNNTRLPSLQSIQAAQQQQQQQQQQRSSLQFDSSSNLPPPEELKGPMNNQGGGGNISGTPSSSSSSSWPPSSSSLNPPQPTNNINNNNNNNQSSSSMLPKFLTCGGILTINSLSPYFDIDTSDIVLRIKSSIRYCNVVDGFRNEVLYSDNAAVLSARSSAGGGGGGGGSGDNTGGDSTIGNTTPGGGGGGKGPDLYGPTWITMTLVFFLAVTSNMSLYFHHKNKKSIMDEVDEGGMAAEEEWDYDINQLLHATWILYSFSFLLPMVVYLIFRLMNVISFSIVDLICLYGYSLVPYLPSTWICTFPVSWLQWLVLCVSTVISGLLVLRNVTGPIMESSVGGGGGGGGGGGMGGQGKSGGLIMAVIGCHFIFFLVLKLGFYHHA